ncbi:MAG: heme ABC transporter ATP-binding protein [Pigmentiphaga sp.]
MPALRVEAVEARRGGRRVLRDVSCVVEPGRLTAVLGANGAGKSTLLAVMAGELAYQGGEVSLDGETLGAHGGLEQARRRAVLPQQVSTGFPLPVGAVVGMGAYPFPEMSQAQVDDEVQLALHEVDLLEALLLPYDALSGGEQQRVQFARVWLQMRAAIRRNGHAYLLMDEPVSNLDPRHQQGLLQAARRMADSGQVGVLVILHDLNLAARWCDALVLLGGGEVLSAGEPAKVLTPDSLALAYGVRPAVLPHPRAPERPWVLFD